MGMISRVRARMQNVSTVYSCGTKEDPRLRDERTAHSGESIRTQREISALLYLFLNQRPLITPRHLSPRSICNSSKRTFNK